MFEQQRELISDLIDELNAYDEEYLGTLSHEVREAIYNNQEVDDIDDDNVVVVMVRMVLTLQDIMDATSDYEGSILVTEGISLFGGRDITDLSDWYNTIGGA